MTCFLKNEVGYSIQPHFKKQAQKNAALTFSPSGFPWMSRLEYPNTEAF